MANKFPLILNTSANQIQEIASGDNLDLTGCKIVGLQGINSAGIVTFTKAHVGAATTWGEDLVVTGNARVTGILTVGTNSVTISGNDVNITGVTTAANFKTGTSNLHNVGLEIAGINVLGADTPIGTGATIYNSGAAVFTGIVTATNYVGTINTPAQPNITSVGTLSALNVSGNVSIGGTLTYEDVTNIDSVGLITARNGVSVTSGGIKVLAGVSNFNANIIGTATTAISITAADESSDTSCNILFATAATGNVAPKTGTNLTFNSSSGALTATSVAGNIVGGTGSFSGDATFNGGAGAITISANSDIRMPTGSWTGDYGAKIQSHDNYLFLQGGSNGVNLRNAAGSRQLNMNNDGHFGPSNSQAYNLGSASLPWTNSYQKFIDVDSASSTNNHALANFNGNATSGNMAGLKIHYYECGSDDNRSGLYWQHENVGNHRMWMDDAGFLRQKSSNPTSDTDGQAYVRLGTTNPSGDLTLTGRVTATDFLIGGNAWYRGANSGYGGLYNATDQTYFYSGDANYFELCFKADQTAGGVRIRDGYEGHTCGYFEANSNNNEIGIKTRSAEWGIKCTMDADTTLYNNGIAVLSTRLNGATFTGSGAIVKSQTTAGTGSNYFQFSDNGGNQAGYIGYGSSGSNKFFIVQHKSDPIDIYIGSASRWQWDTSGNYLPYTNNQVDIGSSSKRVKNIYTMDLQLSNEGTVNEVDGTWGNYTIQEGEDDLFLINRRSGKKYKFNLTEVS